MIRYLLILLVSMLLCSCASSTTYYVKVGGNDGSAGTSWGTAWETTAKVVATVSGGDTTYYGTGTFNGWLLPAAGGSSGDRTVYACSSFVRGIATLTHTTTLTGWVQHSGNVYKTACDGTDDDVWGANNCSVVGQTDGTYDTILYKDTILADVDSAGEYYWNSAIDTIYVWRFGGGDPSASTMQYAEGAVVEFRSGQDYVTIWGFNLKYGEVGGVYFNNDWTDGGHNYNHIEHCNIYWICGPSGVNIGGVQGNYGHAHDSIHSSHQTVVRACSTFYVTEWSTPPTLNAHSSGIGFYSHWRTVVESCYVRAGTVAGHGITFKNEGRYTTVRYNYVFGGNESGIVLLCYYHTDSIYGNIVNMNSGSAYSYYGIDLDGCEPDSNVHVYNNTIYHPSTFAGIQTGKSDAMQAHGYIKYNVISDVQGGYNVAFHNDDYLDYVVDSNLYYPNTVGFDINDGGVDWSTWRTTYGFDSNSTNDVDPGFDSVGAADPWLGFARSGASGEMNLTYGGRTWTKFGAVQESAEAEEKFVIIRDGYYRGVKIR